MNVIVKELERAIKYRERELESFITKLALLKEQQEQYENDLIPKYQQELEELKDHLKLLKIEDEEYPF